MNLEDVGEKALVSQIKSIFRRNRQPQNGLGHDAGILRTFSNQLAISIDRAAAPFIANDDPDYYLCWGRLAAIASISDLLAVNAKPSGLLLSLSLQRATSQSNALDLVRGFSEVCANYDLTIVGGDTKEGSDLNVIGAAIGEANKWNTFDRGSARLGDYIVLSGRLGSGIASALAITEYRKALKKEVVVEGTNFLKNPTLPREFAEAVRGSESLSTAVTSATDLSDGLWAGLENMCHDDCAPNIEIDRIPLTSYATNLSKLTGISLDKLAFGVGDWQILYTVKENQFIRFKNELKEMGLECFSIGRLEKGKKVSVKGSDWKALPPINEHFVKRLEDKNSSYMEWFLS